jgi:hypothetical protein
MQLLVTWHPLQITIACSSSQQVAMLTMFITSTTYILPYYCTPFLINYDKYFYAGNTGRNVLKIFLVIKNPLYLYITVQPTFMEERS